MAVSGDNNVEVETSREYTERLKDPRKISKHDFFSQSSKKHTDSYESNIVAKFLKHQQE